VGEARWMALATAGAIAVGGVGCGSNGVQRRQVTRVAIVTPGRLNDVDWTLGAREAFRGLLRTLHLRGTMADGSASPDVTRTLARLAAAGPQLVIALDSRYAAAAARVAQKTKVPMLVWGDPTAVRPGLVGDVEVDAAEGGYLAGVIAAHAAYTRHVGIVVSDDGSSSDRRTWHLLAGGFIAGARSVGPRIKVSYVEVGSHGDASTADARQGAERLIAGGTQMVFALAGRSSAGILAAVHRAGGEHQFLGAIGGKQTLDNDEYVLAAVRWNFAVAFRQAVRGLRAGTFGKRPLTLSIVNGGLSLVTTGRAPGDATQAAMAARTKIERGALAVPATRTNAEVQALLARR
jgi:basic membrane protein A